MELSEEEKLKTDILFQIDMQLYDEFNDKLCEINGHLGDIYSYKDLQDIENAEKEKERLLLRKAIKEQQKEIILLKIEKLKALKQYKECHLSQIPDTANIYYSMKLELEAIDEEISKLMKIWENY